MNNLRSKLSNLKNACHIFRHYLRWPYPMYKPSQFDSFNHEHTCLASKLTNIELSDICPLAKAGQPFEVARENTCEECKYFCRKVAENLADSIGANLFEIRPEVIYTSADLDWTNKKSRSSLEMSDPTSRPAIAKKRDNMDEYDTIFVEFPIWWYIAPTIVNAFLESYDLTGKTIIPFATSGGSGMGKTNEALKPSCTGATLLEGKVWKSTAKKEELSVWADSLACR